MFQARRITLTVHNVGGPAAGAYSLAASNSAGGILSASALLTIIPVQAIYTQQASAISSTTATLTGVAFLVSGDTVGWFEWGLDTHYGNVTAHTPLGSNSVYANFSGSISNLAVATEYHYRAMAANSAGTVAGDDFSFVTRLPPFVQTGAPTNYWISVACSADGSMLVAAAGQADGIYTSTNSGLNLIKTSAPDSMREGSSSSAAGTKLVAATTLAATTRQTRQRTLAASTRQPIPGPLGARSPPLPISFVSPPPPTEADW